MSNALSVLRYSPAVNPDKVLLKDTISGNYVNGTADAVNLNPNTWTDPLGLGVVGPEMPPQFSPSLWACNCGGYYATFTKGTTLANGGLRWYQPGGAELASGAYPAAITGGEVILEVLITPTGEV